MPLAATSCGSPRDGSDTDAKPAIFVGAFLVLASAFLVYVAWKAAHPTVHKIFVPTDPTLS